MYRTEPWNVHCDSDVCAEPRSAKYGFGSWLSGTDAELAGEWHKPHIGAWWLRFVRCSTSQDAAEGSRVVRWHSGKRPCQTPQLRQHHSKWICSTIQCLFYDL